MSKIIRWFEEKKIFGDSFSICWSYLADPAVTGERHMVFYVDVYSRSRDINIDTNFSDSIQEELRKDGVLPKDCVLHLYNSRS